MAVLGVALFLLAGSVEVRLLKWFAPGLSSLDVGLVTGVTFGAVAAAVVTRLGLWRPLGFHRPERGRDLVVFAPFVIIGLLPLTDGVRAAPSTLAAWVVAATMIAFYKMVVVGVLLVAFRSQGRWRAAGLAASVFAVLEVGGILAGGAALATAALGLLYLFLIFAYGAAWLRTGLLWPLIIANALMTISVAATVETVRASNVANSTEQVLGGVALSVLAALYGGFLLRRGAGGGQS